ncbi:uncharacterized protein [Rutidosis leptorrhynchoides]|uniref:uncharacterized protein isoform X2 n=1 Tax=Rutidosis leptorrhynchoides TaxID=125765 RepID=UPI003A9A052F
MSTSDDQRQCDYRDHTSIFDHKDAYPRHIRKHFGIVVSREKGPSLQSLHDLPERDDMEKQYLYCYTYIVSVSQISLYCSIEFGNLLYNAKIKIYHCRSSIQVSIYVYRLTVDTMICKPVSITQVVSLANYVFNQQQILYRVYHCYNPSNQRDLEMFE